MQGVRSDRMPIFVQPLGCNANLNLSRACKCTHAQCWPAYMYVGVGVGTMVGVYVLQDRNVTTGVIGVGFLVTLALSCILNRPLEEDQNVELDQEAIDFIGQQRALNDRQAVEITDQLGQVIQEAGALIESVEQTNSKDEEVLKGAQKDHKNALAAINTALRAGNILASILDDSNGEEKV